MAPGRRGVSTTPGLCRSATAGSRFITPPPAAGYAGTMFHLASSPGTRMAYRGMSASGTTTMVDHNVGLRAGGGAELEPEVVLPSQYFGSAMVDASLQPEKRLMLAVLEDAVGTYQKYANARERNGQRLFEDVEEWFTADDHQWPYSFVNISQALGLDASYVRRGLDRWRDRQRAAMHGASGNVVRFPFRRVNGSRHMITGRASGMRRSA